MKQRWIWLILYIVAISLLVWNVRILRARVTNLEARVTTLEQKLP